MQGLYAKRLCFKNYDKAPALFLDRDGVIVEEVNYLHRPQDVTFIPGVCEAVAQANRAGYPVIMVTNQAGIGRGLFGWSDFQAVQAAIIAHAALCGADFDMVLACAYHQEGIGGYGIANHPWRKPNPGMLIYAGQVLGVELSRSLIIGDCLSDLMAGFGAGLAGGVLVGTGHGAREWHRGGEQHFASWQRSGSFKPARAANAAEAIAHWLRAPR